MTREQIENGYFEWLCNSVTRDRYSSNISYRKLLTHLHSIPFRYSIPLDGNRAENGKNLRYRYSLSINCEDRTRLVNGCLCGPCSVLEMMVALSIHCEQFMEDTSVGDRTGEWFWGMIVSLGLGSMIDDSFDEAYVDETIKRFLDRKYEPNGKGGLFTIKNCNKDLRKVEIWHQLCWYLNSIT